MVFAAIAGFSLMGMGANDAYKHSSMYPSKEFYYVMLLETFGYATVFTGLFIFFMTQLPGIGCIINQLPCMSLLKFIASVGSIAWGVGTYYLYKFYKNGQIRELYQSSTMLGTLAYTQLLFPVCYAGTCVLTECLSCYCKKSKKQQGKAQNDIHHYNEF
jgi:hypothetical protein